MISLLNVQRVDLLLEMTIYIATHSNLQEAYDTLQRLVQSVEKEREGGRYILNQLDLPCAILFQPSVYGAI